MGSEASYIIGHSPIDIGPEQSQIVCIVGIDFFLGVQGSGCTIIIYQISIKKMFWSVWWMGSDHLVYTGFQGRQVELNRIERFIHYMYSTKI